MAVMIGSARIDENGKAMGGKAGNQTGKEVSTQQWYRHKSGWVVIRAKDPAVRAKQAHAMRRACGNPNIGYDQGQRMTLREAAAKVGYDPGLVEKACECDCSSLVQVCVNYAGIPVGAFRTTNEAMVLLATGAYTLLTEARYTESSDYLLTGDILCTPVQGHTVIVLSDGKRAYEDGGDGMEGGDGGNGTADGRILRRGDTGADVLEMQNHLARLGYQTGGDFGGETEKALKAFQRAHGCDADGEYGPVTRKAMREALGGAEDAEGAEDARYVQFTGDCHIRRQPDVKSEILGIAKKGGKLEYAGQTADNGWHAVKYGQDKGWVSGKYGKLAG